MTAPHGTLASYKSGCRGRDGCADCRAANAAYMRSVRAHNRAVGLAPTDPRHGTATGYQNWGCRCTPCGEAQSKRREVET